jgi:hypothetical protein
MEKSKRLDSGRARKFSQCINPFPLAGMKIIDIFMPAFRKRGLTMSYTCFIRTWWRDNPAWPDGLEPCPGEQRIIAEDVETIEEAREICQEWNESHEEGRYGLKAEFIRD